MNLEVSVIGLNHCTAPVEVRERVTFPGNEDGRIHSALQSIDGVLESMIVSTCNRSEVLTVLRSEEGDAGASETADRVADRIAGIHNLNPDDLNPYLYTLFGRDAVRHAFRVTASLDSMVLGEPQILGQMKESYRRAVAANATGPILNRLMHRSFFTAKRVRSETGIGRAAVSVAYAAVELAKKILGDLAAKRVLLIGAGEMAELAARHLLTQVDHPIVVTNRTYERACSLAQELCGVPCGMEQLDEGLTEADVVITSTGSCDPIITVDRLKPTMKKRRNRPVFLIDIALPRDVDPAAGDIDGVYLYNIDDLQAVVQENLNGRTKEAFRAETLIAEEVEKFMAWMTTLDVAPTIIALRDKLEEIRQGELQRLNGKLGNLSPEEREAIENITRSIINKVAHDPIVFLKEAGNSPKQRTYLDFARKIFGLDGLADKPQYTHSTQTSAEE